MDGRSISDEAKFSSKRADMADPPDRRWSSVYTRISFAQVETATTGEGSCVEVTIDNADISLEKEHDLGHN